MASLAFGRLYDRSGIRVLVLGVVLSFLFAPLVFLGSAASALVGMILWGLGLGSQEAIMSAAGRRWDVQHRIRDVLVRRKRRDGDPL